MVAAAPARLLGVLETQRAEVGVVRVAEGVVFIAGVVLAGYFVGFLEVGIGLEVLEERSRARIAVL